MAITLHSADLLQTLEAAYSLAIGDAELPSVWITRAEQLSDSPSVAFIAAVGAVLLAKATDDEVDALVIQTREGSTGAFNLRGAATALASRRRAFGYDIGSRSDRDPINHGTLIGSPRWDIALGRIRAQHRPFFELILTWLADINRMTSEDALAALAAYIRVRRTVRAGSTVADVPDEFADTPVLGDLVEVLDGFLAADPEGGARGMALVAAAYRMAGFEVGLPSPTDPRRIDIAISRAGTTVIGSEVKQVDTTETTADTLAEDAAHAGVSFALLAVLRPGRLVDFDRTAVIQRAEEHHGVVLRVASGARELLHEAVSAGVVDVETFCDGLPRAFAVALREIRAAEATIEAWAAIASRWE